MRSIGISEIIVIGALCVAPSVVSIVAALVIFLRRRSKRAQTATEPKFGGRDVTS
jgi:hypothetical protein